MSLWWIWSLSFGASALIWIVGAIIFDRKEREAERRYGEAVKRCQKQLNDIIWK
jgi:hypothetical protein